MTAEQLHKAQQRYLKATTDARKARDRAIYEALDAGWSQRQVASAINLTPGRIAQIALKRN